MEAQKLNKAEMAHRMKTSRAPLDRLLDPENRSVTLYTLDKAATLNGQPFLTVGAAIWMDDGKPWAVFTVEDVAYNVDVKEYIRAKGL